MSCLRPASLRSLSIAVCVAVLVASATPKVIAATISWGSAQTVSGDSDVDTTGTLIYAYTFGGTSAPPSATVNGVSFAPFTISTLGIASTTVGSVTLSESPGRLYAFNTFGSGSAPFSGLSSSYQAILGTGAYADLPATITVTLNGLTSGQDYLLQWWTNNSANRSAIFGETFSNTTATAGNAVTLDANTTNVAGGLGQFAIGTFTASGTTQTFALTEPSGFNPLINALQVRAVPEPATTGLAAAAAAAGWIVWRRRSRRAG